MKLYVLANYASRNTQYAAGCVIEVDAAKAAFLMRDAPGCFAVEEEPEPKEKAFERPPADKMLRRPRKAK